MRKRPSVRLEDCSFVLFCFVFLLAFVFVLKRDHFSNAVLLNGRGSRAGSRIVSAMAGSQPSVPQRWEVAPREKD